MGALQKRCIHVMFDGPVISDGAQQDDSLGESTDSYFFLLYGYYGALNQHYEVEAETFNCAIEPPFPQVYYRPVGLPG